MNFLELGGITTALMLFVFACLIWKHVILHRPQFFIGMALVFLILVLNTVTIIADWKWLLVVTVCCQAVAFLALVLATGGMSLKDLKGEFSNAFEVMRRGEENKEIIIPLTGQQPKVKEPAAPPVQQVNPPAPRQPAAPPDRSAIPLD